MFGPPYGAVSLRAAFNPVSDWLEDDRVDSPAALSPSGQHLTPFRGWCEIDRVVLLTVLPPSGQHLTPFRGW